MYVLVVECIDTITFLSQECYSIYESKFSYLSRSPEIWNIRYCATWQDHANLLDLEFYKMGNFSTLKGPFCSKGINTSSSDR